MLILIHLALVGVLFLSVLGWMKAAWRRRRGGITAVAIRGEKSMTFLYVVYGVAAVIFALAVQVSEAAKGYKVAIVVFDYLALTYLFFFNSWFRNWILGLIPRIERD